MAQSRHTELQDIQKICNEIAEIKQKRSDITARIRGLANKCKKLPRTVDKFTKAVLSKQDYKDDEKRKEYYTQLYNQFCTEYVTGNSNPPRTARFTQHFLQLADLKKKVKEQKQALSKIDDVNDEKNQALASAYRQLECLADTIGYYEQNRKKFEALKAGLRIILRLIACD